MRKIKVNEDKLLRSMEITFPYDLIESEYDLLRDVKKIVRTENEDGTADIKIIFDDNDEDNWVI